MLGKARVFLVPRSGAKALDARSRLLHAARRRFAIDGALVPTLDDVRREAGVSVGALYHHFPDKPALAAGVYAQLMSEYQAGFVATLRDHDTAEGGIRGGVTYHLRWVSEHRGEARLLLGDRLDSAALRDANRNFFAAVRDWWRPHHTYGVLRPMRLGVSAALWLGAAQEYSRHWIAGEEAEMPTEAVETFADAAWAVLRTNDIEEREQ
jgi:AcrR family transcriptional regulator